MNWLLSRSGFFSFFILLAACSNTVLNNPYPQEEEKLNVLYSSFSERPKHLDPARSYSANEAVFTAQVYEPPFQYHYLKRPYELVPLAATKLPRPVYLDAEGAVLEGDAASEDVAWSLYEIQIQAGIQYQPHPAFAKTPTGLPRYHRLEQAELGQITGIGDFKETGSRELIAEDYVYQVKRLAHPKIHSPIFGLMTQYIAGLQALGEALKTASADPKALLDLRNFPLEGAEVVDRYTYRIKVKGKYPQFLYWLATPFFAPVPHEADQFYAQPGLIEKNITLDWYPVGTGPYMLTINNPNRQMVLEKNPNFHGEMYPIEGAVGDAEAGLLDDAGLALPFIEKIVFSLEKEGIPIWNKFLQGFYDSSGISSDSFDQAVQVSAGGDAALTDRMAKQGIRLLTSAETSVFFTAFNMLDPLVGGDTEAARKLRQAIALAIDQEEYLSIFRNGRGIAMQGPLPPGIFGHIEGEAGINPYVYDWADGKARRKPIAEARRLLAEAGYPNGRDKKTGKPLIIHFDTTGTSPAAKASFDWMRKQFDKLQIQLVIRNTDYNRFQDKMLKGTAQMFQWGWNADYPDPENFLFLLYGPNAKAGKNGENSANYANPRFDALFEVMKNMENSPKRQEIINEMLDIVRRDVPWASGFYPKQFALYHAWQGNLKPNLMANNTLKYKKVDPVLRRAKRDEWNKPRWWPLAVIAALIFVGTAPAVMTYRKKERGI